MEVVAVTHRKDAIFHTIVGGGLEHQLLGAIPKEATLLTHLRRNFPNVLDVHLSPGGVMRFHLFVKIKKTPGGRRPRTSSSARSPARSTSSMSSWSTRTSTSTIRPRSSGRWRRASRPTAICVIVPESQGSKLDPSNRDGVGAKMGHRRDQAARRRRDDVQAHPRAGRREDRRRRRSRARHHRQLARQARRLRTLRCALKLRCKPAHASKRPIELESMRPRSRETSGRSITPRDRDDAHGDAQALAAGGDHHAVDRRDVGIVAADRQHDVIVAGEQRVGRVEPEPAGLRRRTRPAPRRAWRRRPRAARRPAGCTVRR